MSHEPRLRRLVPLLAWLGLLVYGCTSSESGAAEADASRRADGYRGIWFTLGQFSEHGDKYSGGLGTYTVNHVPMAVYSPAADKTFFTYGGTIEGRRHLLIMASYFDHKTGLVPRPTIVHDKQGVDDPHDNGSINLDDRGTSGSSSAAGPGAGRGSSIAARSRSASRTSSASPRGR